LRWRSSLSPARLPRLGESRRLEGFVHYNLGLLYRQQREYSLAIAAYRQALICFDQRGLVRDTADCHQNIAWLFLVQKKPEEARIHIDLAAALQEEQPDDFAAEQLTLWGFYRSELGEFQTAAQYLRPVLEGLQAATDEKKASAWWVEARILLAQEQRAGAQEALERAKAYAVTAKAAHLINLCTDMEALLETSLGGAAT
jgi:tetratricopeptide (TPR) repeat protein